MAKEEHLKILDKGVGEWNNWRKNNPDLVPDLMKTDLEGKDFRKINFSKTNLNGVNFRLSNLGWANLIDAELNGIDFLGTSLISADLSRSEIIGSEFFGANLWNANFTSTGLFSSIFWRTGFKKTIFRNSHFSEVVIADCDLREALDLDTVSHFGPSTIGIDTILRSEGNIPISFLKGCGVPEKVINTLLPLASGQKFYSCFISFNSKDEVFTKKLKEDLKNKNIQAWYFPEDAKWGDDVYKNIDDAIVLYDKVIVVCSENSLNSEPVLREIERALEKEKSQKKKHSETKRILFPIAIDDYLFDNWDHYLKTDVLRITVGDFKRWKDPKEYKKAFKKLIEALTKENR
jgi:uncharacterized protein YjbI with pentapeptide repeats